MMIFVGGLAVFFALHLTAVTPSLRAKLVALAGENAWKGLVAAGSLGAVGLIVYGWNLAPNTLVFAPSALAIRLAPVLVSLALVLFVIGGAKLPGHLRRTLQHPMLLGVALWSATHLLANGGLRETLLFGAFLAFSLYALGALLLAGKRATFVAAWKWDAIGLAVGVFVAVGAMHGHRWLFGVAVS